MSFSFTSKFPVTTFGQLQGNRKEQPPWTLTDSSFPSRNGIQQQTLELARILQSITQGYNCGLLKCRFLFKDKIKAQEKIFRNYLKMSRQMMTEIYLKKLAKRRKLTFG